MHLFRQWPKRLSIPITTLNLQNPLPLPRHREQQQQQPTHKQLSTSIQVLNVSETSTPFSVGIHQKHSCQRSGLYDCYITFVVRLLVPSLFKIDIKKKNDSYIDFTCEMSGSS